MLRMFYSLLVGMELFGLEVGFLSVYGERCPFYVEKNF